MRYWAQLIWLGPFLFEPFPQLGLPQFCNQLLSYLRLKNLTLQFKNYFLVDVTQNDFCASNLTHY